MTNAIQATDTAVDFGSRVPSILKQRWIEAPAENTATNLDYVLEHRSDSDTSTWSDSWSTLPSTIDDIVESINREISVYQKVFVKEMLQVIENVIQASLIRSTDASTPVLDFLPRHVDAHSVKENVVRLFSLAKSVEFESGMTNAFSERLEELIETHGERALEAIQEHVLNERIPFTIAAEALRYIGNTESNKFADFRRKLLETCLLNSRFMLVRDGAAAGISYIDDSKSIPCLKQAIEQEAHPELRNDLLEVLELLQGTSAE